MTVRLLSRHLADKQKRRMTQLHFSTSLDSKRGHLFRRNLWYELSNTPGDLDSVLVELAFPEQAGEHRTA